MNLENVLNKKSYYNSMNELKKDYKRNLLIESYNNDIEKIKSEMFDLYDVENIYIFGPILEKNQYNVDKISLLIEMSKDMFERMVDNYYLNRYNNINFCIHFNSTYYYYENKRWKEYKQSPDFKLLL